MSLYNDDARQILGMLARGDKSHDIAAWYGENQARIAEVKNGEFGKLDMAPADKLPPSGAPGPKGRRLRAAITQALAALDGGDQDKARDLLTAAAQRFDTNE